ncbi:MAG TPA: WYL domain-containing protein [Egibacteraceae bacterium]|nr:WYL domain-containing protein [Egibacteraceae bacterium]
MVGVDALSPQQVTQALRLLGVGDEGSRGAKARRLAEELRSYGTVRSALERAPVAAKEAFIRVAQSGPAEVEEVLGRGWWGHGALPPPLDWLQARALVTVDGHGLLHAVAEAREGFLELTLDLPADETPETDSVEVAPAAAVVTGAAAALSRAAGVTAAGLRLVAPTVAVSDKPAAVVAAALRAAGLGLADDAVVAASPDEPALPGTSEEAAGPRAIRVLLGRAVTEARQVRLEYFTSSRAGAKTDRVVDPWSFDDDLLRGYCHLRQGERTFAVDRIGRARLLGTPVDHPAAG